MNAWIIAVGSELLTPFRIDANSLTITERLNAVGCTVCFKAVVADNVTDLSALMARAIGEVDLVVCTGGLGPTDDDVTREALAAALGLTFTLDETILATLRARFAARGLTMAEINARQAMVPSGATVLANRVGTAPGLWVEQRGTAFLLLPGPSREMTPMLDAVIAETLAPRSTGAGLFRRVIKIIGRPESEVDALAAPVYRRWIDRAVPISTTILAAQGQIELHFTAAAPTRAVAEEVLAAAVDEMVPLFGDSIYSTNGESLEVVLGHLLRERTLTIAVAESCTGGLLASRLTDVPGSSAYFERGAVCYTNEAKTTWLGVPAEMIAAHGAVSEPVARAMAEGIRRESGADVAVGITGVAGPEGGSPEKPVGTVAIAVLTPRGDFVRTFRFVGDRQMIKAQSAQAAMHAARLLLLD
jgi:nicotinamide-nucleotide amidase